MTLTTTASRVDYQGSGSTGPFSVPFRFDDEDDLLVVKRDDEGTETELTITTHYTVSGAGNATGSVTLVTALASGETLSILRQPAVTQPNPFRNQGTFRGAAHEEALDRIAMLVQALQDQLDRSFGVSASWEPSGLTLRLKPEVGKVLAWASSSQLTNSLLDTSAIAVPGQGRGVSSASGYLANNAQFNVLDYLAAGTGVADDTDPIQDAVDAAETAGGGTVLLPRGTYRITAPIVGTARVRIVGEPGTIIDLSEVATARAAIEIKGSRGTATALTGNVAEGDTTIPVTSESGFEVGGWALIRSTAVAGSVGTRGELVRIATVAAGSLTIYQPLCDAYATADSAEIAPLTMVESPSVQGIRFVGGDDTGVNHQGVFFEYCLNASVLGCEFKHCHHLGIGANYVAGLRVSDNHFEDSLAASVAYGLALSRATQDVTMTGCTGRRLRHLFTAGVSDTVGQSGMPRRVTVVANNAFECTDAAFDGHPGCDDFIFAGNTAIGTGAASGTGILFQGSRVIIANNTIRNVGSSGIVVQLLSARHSSAVVIGNNLHRTGMAGGSGAGIIVDAQDTWDDYNGVIIANNEIDDHRGTSAAIMIDDPSGGAYNTRGAVIIGNAIVYRAVGGRGIDIAQVDDFVIANNSIRMEGSTVLEGISLLECNDGVVSGNTVNGVDATNGGRGIRMTTCVDVVIVGNRLKLCVIGILFASDVTHCRLGDNHTRSCTTAMSLSTGAGNVLNQTQEIGADVGDAAKTLTLGQSERTQVWNTPISTNRAVTLSTTHVTAGGVFRIVRTAAATGAFNLNVGTGPLAALAAGEWCEVTYNGSAWVLTAFGALS